MTAGQTNSDPRRVHELLRIGRGLQSMQAKQLEQSIDSKGDDIDSRIVLLAYHDAQKFKSEKSKEARLKYVTWMIRHHPDNPAAGMPICSVLIGVDDLQSYIDVRSQWIEQLQNHKEQTAILSNAAQFFILNEIEKSESCLLAANAIEPLNSRWPLRLSHLYKLWGSGFEQVALEQGERALALVSSEKSRLRELATVCELAYEAGQHAKAANLSEQLLNLASDDQNNFYYGTAMEAAHTTLGRVALARGDRKQASHHLVQSISHGRLFAQPEKHLVAELFAAGERDAVKEWLEQCSKYLSIDQWKVQIENGQSPWSHLLPERHKYFSLSHSPRSLFNSGRQEQAGEAAIEFLELSKHDDDPMVRGYGIHIAHGVLGQLALKNGDIALAKEHLEKSSTVPKSQRLMEHGPDMSLAADLTRSGAINEVLEFLRQCDVLWGDRKDRLLLKVWSVEVEAGKLPSDWRDLCTSALDS